MVITLARLQKLVDGKAPIVGIKWQYKKEA